MVDRVSAPLIGRDRPLNVLVGNLERARSGDASVVLVSGETGVGKTRLVTEFLARERPAVLAGTCVPLAGEPLPYAALTQALRQGSGVVREATTRSPELARLLPGMEAPTTPGAGPTPGSGDRLRLFQAVLALLARMGAERPVVHVVEDLHWADRSTLDLLAFLATNLRDERVMVLLTYRADSVDRQDPLSRWLAELGRLHHTERVLLDRLEQAEATELVTALTGQAPDPERLEDTLARSAGNPLFVEQLVLAGGRDGPLPATLHGLLESRVATLPDGTRRLLGAAAVIGRASSVPLLAGVLADGVESVEDHLRPALNAHVTELRSDDTIGFQHPAFREVVYAELLPGERRRLHRAAAEALTAESAAEPEVVGEIARHWHLAGDLPRALDSSVAAGHAYERLYAFADARDSYQRALDLLPAVPNELDAVDLRTRAGECASLSGDYAAAISLIGEALAGSTAPAHRAALLQRLGSCHFLAGDGPAAESAFREALDLLPPGETSTLAARLHAGVALLAVAWSRLDEAEAACAEALRISRAIGAHREEGLALNAHALVLATRGDLEEGERLLRASLDIARETGQPNDLGSAYANLSHVLALAGRIDAGLTLARTGIVELGRYGQDRQNGSLLLFNIGDMLLKSGRVVEAEELIAAALARHPRGIMAAPVLLAGARSSLIQGDLTTAWERCEQARLVVEAESAPGAWLREILETGAEIELWAGRPEAALELVWDALSAIAGTDEMALGSMLVALGLRALADQVAVRREARARTQHDSRRDTLLTRLGEAHERSAETDVRGDPVVDLLCHAEQGRLDGDGADAWRDVASAWEGLERPFPAAYARWREAESRLRQGVGAAAIAPLRAAHATARELGATLLVEEAENLARWYRVDLLPESPVADPAAEAHPLDSYGLTSREREVLDALAAGHTNQEIATTLFISVKTASVHVSNILRKLDVRSRGEAARLAHRLGA